MAIPFLRCRKVSRLRLLPWGKRTMLSVPGLPQAPAAIPWTRNSLIVTAAPGPHATLAWSSSATLMAGLSLPPRWRVAAPGLLVAATRRRKGAKHQGVRDVGIQIDCPTQENTLLPSILYGVLYDVTPIVGACCSIVPFAVTP